MNITRKDQTMIRPIQFQPFFVCLNTPGDTVQS